MVAEKVKTEQMTVAQYQMFSVLNSIETNIKEMTDSVIKSNEKKGWSSDRDIRG